MKLVQQTSLLFAVAFCCITTQQTLLAVDPPGATKVFTEDNSDLPSNYITDIAIDQQGRVWLGSGGLTLFHNDTWTTFPEAGVIEIATDSDNNAWVASGLFSGVLAKCDGTTVTYYNAGNSGIPSDWTSGITVDNNNTVWVACSFTGVGEFDGSTWTKHLGSEIGSGSILPMAHSPNNTIWMGTQDGLYRYQNEQWEHFTPANSDLPSAEILSITCASDNSTWVGTASGLMHIEDAKWTLYNTENTPLLSDTINALAIDDNEVLWVGTNKGVATYESKTLTGMPWIVKTMDNWALPSNEVRSIAVSPTNGGGQQEVWIGTNKGLLRFTEAITDVANQETIPALQVRIQPNPCTLRATATVQLEAPAVLDLVLYNEIGEKVTTVASGMFPAGEHILPFDVHAFPSGVYYCTAVANGRTISSQHMVIRR